MCLIKISMIMKHSYGQMGFPKLHKTLYSKQHDYEKELKEYNSQKMINRGYRIYTPIIQFDNESDLND